jgi:hypothetical protein
MKKNFINTKLGIYDIHMSYVLEDHILLKNLLNFTSIDNEGNSTIMQISNSFNNHDFPNQKAIRINIQTFKNNKHITGLSVYLDVVSVQFLIDNLQNMVDKIRIRILNEEKTFKKKTINDST